MTEQTFTTTTTGALTAEVISHIGQITVRVDRAAKHATATVRTTDTEGPAADAVREATLEERGGTLRVRVPQIDGGIHNQVNIGGNSISFNGGVGTVISGGDIYVAGRRIVSNGRVVAQQGTVIGGSGSGSVTVLLTLPPSSSLRVTTTSADLEILGGLKALDVHSVSGDVQAQDVHDLIGQNTSGDIEVERVTGFVSINTISGDTEIGAYGGGGFRANSVSGDILVSATPDASGEVTVNTVSGDINTRGVGHLDVRSGTVSGKERVR